MYMKEYQWYIFLKKKRWGFDIKKMDGWIVPERKDLYERMGTVHPLKKKDLTNGTSSMNKNV